MTEVRLVNVSFKYREKSPPAISNVNISFKEGEMTIIHGPNGSGKTTLMKIASLIFPPTTGEVLLNGKNFWSYSEKERTLWRRKLIYVHERPIMINGTVMDNIILGLILRGNSIDKAKETAIEWMNKLKIADIAYRKANSLSAGQMQLISIIRAILLSPSIMFLDEPFAHLDKERRTLLEKAIKEELNGIGIVMTSHDESLFLKFDNARKVYVEDGRVQCE